MNPLKPEEMRLLTQVGFLAGATRKLKDARTIFSALERLRPDASAPYVGMALALLNRREYDEAVRTLDRALQVFDDDSQVAEIHAVRALALHLAGRGAECTRAASAAAGHPLAAALTESLRSA
jgi:tetratricopeptide (TPR) repeat protein